MHSLTNIAFKQIRDNYWLGQYGDFTIVLLKDSGWVNATKLCTDGGKRLHDWKRLEHSKALITELQGQIRHEASNFSYSSTQDITLSPCSHTETHIPASVCKRVVTENISPVDQLIYGTYYHPDLIPSIAGWISPMFALRVNRIVNNYLLVEYETKLAEAEQKQHAAEQQLHAAQQEAIVIGSKVLELTEDLISTDTALINKKAEFNIWSSTHAFTLLRLNDVTAKMPYYTIRCKRRDMSHSIRKMRKRHPFAEVIFQHRRVTNSINLYQRLCTSQHLTCKRNYCNPTADEATLIKEMTALCGTEHRPINVIPLNAYVQQSLMMQPLTTTTSHTVCNTPPASPPIIPPTTMDTFTCYQCQHAFSSMYLLYLHRQSCGFITRLLNTTPSLDEPAALWNYTPINCYTDI